MRESDCDPHPVDKKWRHRVVGFAPRHTADKEKSSDLQPGELMVTEASTWA